MKDLNRCKEIIEKKDSENDYNENREEEENRDNYMITDDIEKDKEEGQEEEENKHLEITEKKDSENNNNDNTEQKENEQKHRATDDTKNKDEKHVDLKHNYVDTESDDVDTESDDVDTESDDVDAEKKGNGLKRVRHYLDIMKFKFGMNENWENIRNKDNYIKVKKSYLNTIKNGTNPISLDKMYEKTNWGFMRTFSMNDQAFSTILYDKYIRFNNSNICMPHLLKIKEICSTTSEDSLTNRCQINTWYNPLTKKRDKPELIGKEKIPSYLKGSEIEFNSLSKLKYAIERCINNKEYNNRNKIKGIFIPLSVTILQNENKRQEVCDKSNHANMIYIKIRKKTNNEKK